MLKMRGAMPKVSIIGVGDVGRSRRLRASQLSGSAAEIVLSRRRQEGQGRG